MSVGIVRFLFHNLRTLPCHCDLFVSSRDGHAMGLPRARLTSWIGGADCPHDYQFLPRISHQETTSHTNVRERQTPETHQ